MRVLMPIELYDTIIVIYLKFTYPFVWMKSRSCVFFTGLANYYNIIKGLFILYIKYHLIYLNDLGKKEGFFFIWRSIVVSCLSHESISQDKFDLGLLESRLGNLFTTIEWNHVYCIRIVFYTIHTFSVWIGRYLHSFNRFLFIYIVGN